MCAVREGGGCVKQQNQNLIKFTTNDYMTNLVWMIGDKGMAVINCKDTDGNEVCVVKTRILHVEAMEDRVKIMCDGGEVYYYP